MYPAQRAQFHRIWKQGCKAGYLVGQESDGHAHSRRTAGEHGGGMPCLQPERECMDSYGAVASLRMLSGFIS